MIDMEEILTKMTDNNEINKNLFVEHFRYLDYVDGSGNTLPQLIMTSKVPTEKKRYAFLTLIKNGVSYDTQNIHGDTIIHTALKNNCDIDFILDILRFMCSNGFNINTRNNTGYTIIHTAITNLKNHQDIIKLIEFVSRYNFNFNSKDMFDYSIINYVDFQNNFSYSKKKQIKDALEKGVKNMEFRKNLDNNQKENSNDKNKIEDYELKYNTGGLFDDGPIMQKLKSRNNYGTFLTDYDYLNEPAIGRKKEIESLIVSLAIEQKIPLLIGPSGTGKTAIVDELAYLIQNDYVPNFIKDKSILEVSVGSIVSGTTFRGSLEKRIKEIAEYALKNDSILFIDEFHSLKGAGAATEDKNDALSILREYTDRRGLKVIGATTEDSYDEILSSSDLKRRFEIIKVSKLPNNVLMQIIEKTIIDNAEKYNVEISENIINNMNDICEILLEATDIKHLVYNDIVNNPDLVISIINKSFAYTIVNEEDIYDLKHLILALDINERIYDTTKQETIKKLKSLQNVKTKKKTIIYKISDYIK